MNYDYPGNIRELENIVERCVVLESGDGIIALSTLPAVVRQNSQTDLTATKLPIEGLDLEDVVARLETDLIEQALKQCNGNKTRAAELLGLTFRSLRYRLDKYGLK